MSSLIVTVKVCSEFTIAVTVKICGEFTITVRVKVCDVNYYSDSEGL